MERFARNTFFHELRATERFCVGYEYERNDDKWNAFKYDAISETKWR